eukprot:Skav217302  [mRNA]  locus=scaffold1466:306679:325933:+ [translate_table: standard]
MSRSQGGKEGGWVVKVGGWCLPVGEGWVQVKTTVVETFQGPSDDATNPVLVVGGGPVGLRLAIELRLGGHSVTVFEKRREQRSATGDLEQLGFTNRRPSGVGDTSSIGIDELQLLLLKNALLLGVDFKLGMGYEDAEIVLDPKSQKPRWQVNPNKVEEKNKLKRWVLDRCKEAGIPVDDTLSNSGFVEEPNDVMAFDFSEIWKCKKNFAFNLPPPTYDTQVHGPWTGTALVPPIGLVGDAVTEPFWIAGVGLQRGWNGVMDASYLIDNLYNMSFSGDVDALELTSWNEHVQKLQQVIPKLYDCSHDGRMTREGLQGEYADQGVVMMQLNKQMKDSDAEKPQWQLKVDPFHRYEQFAKAFEESGDGSRASPKLISVNGRELVTTPAAYDHASSKSESLQAMLSKQIDEHVQRNRLHDASTAFDDRRWVPTAAAESGGFAQMAERQRLGWQDVWEVMTEQHLSPSQRAELLHVRNMISSLKQQMACLSSSLEAFERAERELLINGGSTGSVSPSRKR